MNRSSVVDQNNLLDIRYSAPIAVLIYYFFFSSKKFINVSEEVDYGSLTLQQLKAGATKNTNDVCFDKTADVLHSTILVTIDAYNRCKT